MEQIHYHVFEGPSSLSGRLLQVVFLVPLLGAVPAAAFGAGVAAWVRGGGAGARRLPRAMAWTAYPFQALGFVSSGLVIDLFGSEVDIEALPKELVGPFGSVVGAALINMAAGLVGVRSWRKAAARAKSARSAG